MRITFRGVDGLDTEPATLTLGHGNDALLLFVDGPARTGRAGIVLAPAEARALAESLIVQAHDAEQAAEQAREQERRWRPSSGGRSRDARLDARGRKAVTALLEGTGWTLVREAEARAAAEAQVAELRAALETLATRWYAERDYVAAENLRAILAATNKDTE